jgi:hypothetical protein
MELQGLMGFFVLAGAAPRGRSAPKPMAKALARAGNLRTLTRAADESSGEFTRF